MAGRVALITRKSRRLSVTWPSDGRQRTGVARKSRPVAKQTRLNEELAALGTEGCRWTATLFFCI